MQRFGIASLVFALTASLTAIAQGQLFEGDDSGVFTNQVINSGGPNPGNTTANWQSVWDDIDNGNGPTGLLGSGNYNIINHAIDTENYFDYDGGGWFNPPTLNTNTINSDGPGGGGGPISNGNDYSVRGQTILEFTVGGTYTIGMASDDGRTIKLTEALPGSGPRYSGFDAASGQGREFSGAGDTEIGFSGGTGHNDTRGRFTVAAGDFLALDAFYYEGGGGDSGEIAIFQGDGLFSAGQLANDGFVILQDGAFGAINLHSSIQAVPEPASIAIWTLLGLSLCGFGYYRLRRK